MPEPATSAPEWAGLPAGTDWDRVPETVKTQVWLASMQPSIAGWVDFDMPAGFRDDYTRQSLVELQAVLLERYPNPEEDTLIRGGTLFLERAARYVGETLLRVYGGHWLWNDMPNSFYSGQPILVFDHDDTVPSIAPFEQVRSAIRTRSDQGTALTWDFLEECRRERAAEDPGFVPVKEPTPGLDGDPDSDDDPDVLAAFTAARDTDLDRWAEISGAPADTWDLSLTSLDTLARLVMDRHPDPEELSRPRPGTWEQLAVRYLGETLFHLAGGRWHWRRKQDGTPIKTTGSEDMYLERFFLARDDPGGYHTAIPNLFLVRLVKRRDPGASAVTRPTIWRCGHDHRPAVVTAPDWAVVRAGVDWAGVPPEVKVSDWVGSMDSALDGWRATALPGDLPTDGSRRSLGLLERLLLDSFEDWQAVSGPGGYRFAECSAATSVRPCSGSTAGAGSGTRTRRASTTASRSPTPTTAPGSRSHR